LTETFLGPILIVLALALPAVVLSAWLLHAIPIVAVGAPPLVGVAVGVWVVALALPDRPLLPAGITGVAVVALGLTYARRRPTVTPVGAMLWTTWLVFAIVSVAWGVLFLRGLHLSVVTEVLLWCAVGLAGLTLPSAIVTTREGWEPLLRARWRRHRTGRPDPPSTAPFVSIHVPCHAEPPDLVISTLDRLAALDYSDFEVIVVDNNTTDARLWRPVQAHCARLGSRFRFIHVEGLTGAKAGALNLALQHTDPRATLIGVVDADYHVEPGWLGRTIGYFDDRSIGFVQCPHAYRDYDGSRFGRWANSEYAVFFAAGMVSLDEHQAGLTVGTMSLIRRQVLEEVGGWAEWCLTEDSELAIRIHAAGYESVYLTEKYGRGLIPQTLAAYRAQRFRWTFGPVQEFQRHWRVFRPRILGGRSRLSAGQKLHHANHGLDVIGIGIRAVAAPLGACAAISMLVHGEHVPVPVELWVASTSVLASSLAVRYLVYTRVVKASPTQALAGTMTFAALGFVIRTASLAATFGLRATWHRTAKFPQRRVGLAAVRQAKFELSAAVVCLAGAAALIVAGPVGGLVTMLAIALAIQGAGLLCTPVVAIVADRSLHSAPDGWIAARADVESLTEIEQASA
jgi:hypothetical protein